MEDHEDIEFSRKLQSEIIGSGFWNLSTEEDSSKVNGLNDYQNNDRTDYSPSYENPNLQMVATNRMNPCITWGWTWGRGLAPLLSLQEINKTLNLQEIANESDNSSYKIIEESKKVLGAVINKNIIGSNVTDHSRKVSEDMKQDIKPTINKHIWLKGETSRLIEAYKLYGFDLKKITKSVGTRKTKSVRAKLNLMFPDTGKKHLKWDKEEDEELLKVKEMMPDCWWAEIQRVYYPEMTHEQLEYRWCKLMNLDKRSRKVLNDYDTYKYITFLETDIPVDQLLKHFKGKTTLHLQKALKNKLKPYLLEYRLSFLEYLVDPCKMIMKTPWDIELSKARSWEK